MGLRVLCCSCGCADLCTISHTEVSESVECIKCHKYMAICGGVLINLPYEESCKRLGYIRHETEEERTEDVRLPQTGLPKAC